MGFLIAAVVLLPELAGQLQRIKAARLPVLVLFDCVKKNK